MASSSNMMGYQDAMILSTLPSAVTYGLGPPLGVQGSGAHLGASSDDDDDDDDDDSTSNRNPQRKAEKAKWTAAEVPMKCNSTSI
jgi:hypothetical protein